MLLELFRPIFRRLRRCFTRVEILNNACGEVFLRLHWMGLTLHPLNLRHLHVSKQFVVAPHHFVGNGHQLAIHFEWRLFNPDRVSIRFRHLLHAIESFKNGHSQYHLRFLTVCAL